MMYNRLQFSEDVEEWFQQILHSNGNLLLCPRDHTLAHCNSPEKGENNRQLGLFTSATTGDPKCIWNSVDNLLQNARITSREFEISSSDRLLMMAKPWHVAGLSWVLMAEDIGVSYSFLLTRSGEGEQWYKAIREYQPSHIMTVPQVLRTLFEYDDWFVPNIIYGGASIYENDYKLLSHHTKYCYQGYGQTEAGGLISCQKIIMDGQRRRNISHCYGKPPSEFSIHCEGTPDHPEPIWLKSPTAIYDNYYDTGDLGYMDHSDDLYLIGRKNK